MKLGRSWKAAGVLVLGGAAIWLVSFIKHIPPQKLASLLGISVSVTEDDVTPKPTPTPAPVNDSSTLGTVAVQTFSGPVLIRQGSGTAVSADGLVLTTAVTAPFGSGSFIYQIATPRGQLLRARRVASDAATGLALLKVDANDLDAVLFDAKSPLSAGSQWEAVSAQVVASKFVALRLPVWVVSSVGDRQTVLSMDHAYAVAFNGARLIDASGRSVGLIRNASQPLLIPAALINTFLERYLGQTIKN